METFYTKKGNFFLHTNQFVKGFLHKQNELLQNIFNILMFNLNSAKTNNFLLNLFLLINSLTLYQMRSFKKWTLLAVGIGLASCSPKFYTINSHNVPLLSEKGETNLTVAGNDNRVEFQGAYAVTNNFALKADGGLFIPSDLDNGDGGSGKFFEFGGGYLKPITENWIFESYGILGFGSVENHLPSTKDNNPGTNGDLSANILRIGIQPNLGYKSEYFSVAISSRFVNLSYNNIEGDLIYGGKSQTQYLEDNSSSFLIEPAITVRGGFKKIKLQLQHGYSYNFTNSAFKQDVAFFTVGLNFNFN